MINKLRDWLGEKAKIEAPTDSVHGDYSTNLALKLGRPASEVAAELEKTKPEFIEKIAVAGPGFINFFLKTEFVVEEIRRLAENPLSSCLKRDSSVAKKVLFEYTDPNPFKEFHIGHLMSNTIGEALSRLTEAMGAEVKRACYQGDVGLHVAKALYGKQRGAATWGEAYVAGSKAFEEDEEAKQEIIALNKKVYERSDPALNELYEQGKKETLAEFEKIYQKLGTKFDFYFFEGETGAFGKKLVEENVGKVFEKSDGAIVFRGEQYAGSAGEPSLHTRVFINSEGLPTYEAKELGLAKIKFDRYAYDESVIITGNEVNDYFRVLLKALELIFPDLARKTRHLGHGMLRLPTGKMSSRTGKVITAESLIETVATMVTEKMKDQNVRGDERYDISEKVAIGAIKYAILRQSPGKDIIFDPHKFLSFEGDSGPYLQYTRARAHSILEKAGSEILRTHLEDPGSKVRPLGSDQISVVERKLIHFPEVVARAARELAPQHLVTYLTELASAFNAYYAQNQIIGSPEEQERLTLTRAVESVLTAGLNLLAIPVLDRM